MARQKYPYNAWKTLRDADAALTADDLTAQELRIDPSGTETIALPSSGAQGAAGKYLTADAVGEWVKLVCVKAGQWQVEGYAGTWAHEG